MFVSSALKVGLTIPDLDALEAGEVLDIMIERANDDCEYRQLATQDDFDKF